jgi:transposase-like protein
MRRNRLALFKGRHFEAEMIVLCVRWYLRFGLSFRDLEEMMAERNLSVDHVTIWRWVQRYAPELNRRCRPELRQTNRSWRVDETEIVVPQAHVAFSALLHLPGELCQTNG